MVSAEEMESFLMGFIPQSTAKNTKCQHFGSELLHTRNERNSLSENIDVDILSRPVDKDNNCTELCRVLFLFVVSFTIPL